PAQREIDEIYLLNAEAADHFHKNLLTRPEAAPALAYLKGRGITAETISLFSIGFALPRRDDLLKAFGKKFPLALLEKAGLISKKEGAPSSRGEEARFDRFRNRILFPIRTPQGKVVGFGGRVLDDSLPKYLNTPETPVFTKGKHLFALDRAKAKGIHSLIIVEGYFDAVAAHQAGVPNVVATLGTALTQDHLHLISRVAEKVVLIFDPDEAGVRAALRAAPLFIEKGMSAEVVSLPLGEDPDLFIRKHGKERFLEKMAEGKTLIDFSISKWAQSSSSKSINDKIKVIGNIFPLINKLKNAVEQSHYLKTLSDELGVKEEDLRAEFANQAKSARPAGGAEKNGKIFPAAPMRSISRLPQDEETLLALLLQGRLDPSALNGRLDPEDFTEPEIKNIISRFWDPQRSQWLRKEGKARPDSGMSAEESDPLFRRLIVSEPIYDDLNQTIEDCIISLQAKRLRREASEIQRKLKLAEKGGDLAVVHSLRKRFFDLKKELSRLTLS
ncbi:MAG TPA: DNA primase, partial [Candidatus Manganitrophaceae bacterium]|nr:DNA primase [Candidatus Manganitrophaceae bacterium]